MRRRVQVVQSWAVGGMALALVMGLSLHGCDPKPAPEVEAPAATTVQVSDQSEETSPYVSVRGEWIHADPVPGPPGGVKCKGHDDKNACRKGGDVFARCANCHMDQRFHPRRAPTLEGLLGRKRVFTSGQSVVADEAYIRRSIEDHQSTDEYVRGYKGSVDWNHPNKREQAYARKRELDRWQSRMGKDSLSPEEVEAVLAYVMPITQKKLPDGRLTYELVGTEKLDAQERVRREIEARLESVEQCYRRELAWYPNTAGSLTLELKRLSGSEPLQDRALEDILLEDSLQDPDVARCALGAVDDIAHVMLYYEPVPQGTKIIFHFANK